MTTFRSVIFQRELYNLSESLKVKINALPDIKKEPDSNNFLIFVNFHIRFCVLLIDKLKQGG